MRWIVMACMLVAGCAAQNEVASYNYTIKASNFTCPKAGTQITYTDGGVIRYTGVDPKNPIVCTGIFRNQTALRRIYNYYNATPSYLENAPPAMAQLFPAVAGKSTRFVHFGNPAGAGTFSQRNLEEWRVLGGEDVRVEDKSVHTIVFEREQSGIDATNTALIRYRSWYAPELGVWLRSNVTAVRGYTPDRSYAVESVYVP